MNSTNYNKSAALAIGAILSSVKEMDRSTVLRNASDLSYGNKKLAKSLLPQIIPSNGSVELANNICNGTTAILRSIKDANGSTTLRTLLSRAKQSYGEGSPFNGGPEEIGNSIPLAVAAMAAPDVTLSNADKEITDLAKQIAKAYDCDTHAIPLGGCAAGPVYWDQVALAGGLLQKWREKRKQKLRDEIEKEGKEKQEVEDKRKELEVETDREHANQILTDCIPVYAAYRSATTQEQMADALAELQRASFNYSKYSGGLALMEELAKVFGGGGSSTLDNRANGIIINPLNPASLDNMANSARAEIEAAMEKMAELVNQQSQLKEASQQLSLNLARLAWAKAALSASDEVALLMTMVTPDMSSTSSILNTMINTMGAARKTGSVSNMGALINAIKAGFSKGNLDTSTFDALFGDPEGDVEAGDSQDLLLPEPTV